MNPSRPPIGGAFGVYLDRRDQVVATRQSARTNRALAAIEHDTKLRMANARAEGMVVAEQAAEVDSVAQHMAAGQALLQHWATTLAAGDQFLAEDLRIYAEVAKIGKADLLAGLIDRYSREGRR